MKSTASLPAKATMNHNEEGRISGSDSGEGQLGDDGTEGPSSYQRRHFGLQIRPPYASVSIASDVETSDRQRRCVRILLAISIALLVDVVLLMSYVYSNWNVEARSGDEVGDSRLRLVDNSNDDISSWGVQWMPLPPRSQTMTKIIFGSCSSQLMPQPYWDSILAQSPDLVLLMGDNVYGDCQADSCNNLLQAYRDWSSLASFQGATRSVPIIATLDDHDYGQSDAWSGNPHKDKAKTMFLDFFNIHDVRRLRLGDGVYQHFEFGANHEIVQIVMLDTRYARSEFLSSGNDSHGADTGPYMPDVNATNKQMLSPQQWEWLEKEVVPFPARVRLIVSSVQALNQKEGSGFEMWRMISHELDRLRILLAEQASDSLNIILSGDRHTGGFYKYVHTNGHELYDVTASSWTHTIPFGAYYPCSSAEECDEKDPARIGDFVRENHFGQVQIDWPNNQVIVSLRRTDTTPFRPYSDEARQSEGRDSHTDAGHVLKEQQYVIP